MPKICEMGGVREYCEGFPVEPWRDEDNGRLVIKVVNEGSFNGVLVDLWDLLDRISAGPHAGDLNVGRDHSVGKNFSGH